MERRNPPSKLEQATDARLQEIRDVVRSGVTERTGKAARIRHASGEEERGRSVGGMRSSYPELGRLPDSDTPKKIAGAIERGRGVVYRRVRQAVRMEMSKFYEAPRVRRERPTVPAHPKLTRKCKTCNVAHGKGQHRFHGKGAYHQTHLFSFNPLSGRSGPTRRRSGVGRSANPTRSSRPVKIYGNVTRIYLKGGSYALARRPAMYGLPSGDLLITWGKPGDVSDSDREVVTRSYGKVTKIEAQKTQRHLCDQTCKKIKHQYYHPFTEPNEMVQLRDGSLLISSL